MSSVFADGRTQRARYDTEGRLLELRSQDATGALLSVETRTWQDGRELRRQTDQSNGRSKHMEWYYKDGRLVLLTSRTNDYVLMSGYSYDEQGRLVNIDTGKVTGYSYDEMGNLIEIFTEQKCLDDENRCGSFSYWPDGTLRQHSWSGYMWDKSDEYNELGQLILSRQEDSSSTRQTSRTYDAEGRLSLLKMSYYNMSYHHESRTTTVHDPGGWRERFADDGSRRGDCDSNICEPDYDFTYQRRTRRTTFFCGTQIVALDEWDGNEDGSVDAHRTYERDSTGRLVREAYSGTPGLDAGPTRRDFDYDCH
ncbi:MAG: hypothetical protein ABW123_01305 [Cystobacter sp.]